MAMPKVIRRETVWAKIFIVAFMVITMATACTTTKLVRVRNQAGDNVDMQVRSKLFSNEFVSAYVPGETVGVSKPASVGERPPQEGVLKSLGCQYCAQHGSRWVWYPPSCTCP